ncbi:MAG: hypothetical protein ACKO7P_16080 [Bacteroidota bacterium]
MEHLLIIDPSLQGREYGTLSAFQSSIEHITGSKRINLPEYNFFEKRFLQSSRWRFLRRLSRRKNIAKSKIQADVLWYILMGPENYRLDMFNGYEDIPIKIIYFFDTLPHQFGLINKLKLDRTFNIKITSFPDALDKLEILTKSKWEYVPQASINPRILPDLNSKTIAFCSYGRSNRRLNEIIKNFCSNNNLYFDCTNEGQGIMKTSNLDLYQSYLWHTAQSIFNVSFSVESTHPSRAGILSPITCRWFEAILSRNIVVGQSPLNREFEELFPNGFVRGLNLDCTDEEVYRQLEDLWKIREELFNNLYGQLDESYFEKYVWDSRVLEICKIIDSCAE